MGLCASSASLGGDESGWVCWLLNCCLLPSVFLRYDQS